ncbi:MAG: mechanosensitive ion channel family protein [Planctomycetota bacterium]
MVGSRANAVRAFFAALAGAPGALLAQGPPGAGDAADPAPPPISSPEADRGAEGAPPEELTGWLAAWDALGAVGQMLAVLVFATLLYFAFRWVLVRRLERWSDATTNDLDDRLVHFIKQFFGIALVIFTIGAVLKIWGVEITPLLAGAGIAGVALGFAAKETIADILAGVFLIADRPMRIGDRVKVERIGRDWGGWGDVVDIGLRRTQIRNTDGVVVNYPNAFLANSVITNFSHETDPVRVRVRFQVSYDTEFGRLRELCEPCVESAAGVVPGSAEMVVRSIFDQTRGHLLSGVLVEVRYRIEDIAERTRIRSVILQQLLTLFAKESIELAQFETRVRESDS